MKDPLALRYNYPYECWYLSMFIKAALAVY